MSRLHLLLVVALLPTALTAQLPSVIPSAYAGKEGGGNSEAPADWEPVHMQAIYDKAAITPGGGAFRGIRFRRDGGTSPVPRVVRSVKIELASRGVPAPEFSSTIYEGNRGTDQKTMFDGSFNFPADSGGTGPRPFNIDFKLDNPFIYFGGNLLVEITVKGKGFSQSKYRVDATPGVVVRPQGKAATVGTGCPTQFKQFVIGNPPWPGALLWFFGNSRSGRRSAAAIAIGSQRRNVDLGFIGMPRCTLLQDVAVTVDAQTDGSGVLTAKLGRVPRDPSAKGKVLRFQSFVLDAGFNALGIRASSSLALTIGNGFPAGLEAHAWYDRRDNTGGVARQADFRSTRTPIIQVY